MRLALVAALVLVPTLASSAGLLGDALNDLNRASANIGHATARVDVDRAVAKIERAEIAQNLHIDALTKRVIELEGIVKQQQDLLTQYQKVVADLQSKVGGTR